MVNMAEYCYFCTSTGWTLWFSKRGADWVTLVLPGFASNADLPTAVKLDKVSLVNQKLEESLKDQGSPLYLLYGVFISIYL